MSDQSHNKTNQSGDSSPIPPWEAANVVIRQEIGAMRSHFQDQMQEVINLLKSQTEAKQHQPTLNHHQASSSSQPPIPNYTHQPPYNQNTPYRNTLQQPSIYPPIYNQPTPPYMCPTPPPPYRPAYTPYNPTSPFPQNGVPQQPAIPLPVDDEDGRVSLIGSGVDEGFQERDRGRLEDDRGLRIDLPEFDGGINPDDFLEWLHAIERVFDYKDYSEEKRCKLAILKFRDYASLWYENLKNQRGRDGKERVRTWTKLKKLLSKRFLPREYKQELYQKMYSCRQEKRSVAEFIVDFEKLMIRTDCEETKEHTIARFLGGLNRDIAHAVELQPHS